jgi:hypothetical protein
MHFPASVLALGPCISLVIIAQTAEYSTVFIGETGH